MILHACLGYRSSLRGRNSEGLSLIEFLVEIFSPRGRFPNPAYSTGEDRFDMKEWLLEPLMTIKLSFSVANLRIQTM